MVRGSTALTDYSGIDFSGDNQGIPEARIGVLSTGSGTKIQFGTSNAYVSGITNTAMTVDYTGYIGIGTASPAVPLQVSTAGVSQTFAGGGATAGTWASHSSGAVTTSILASSAIVGGSVYASSDRRLKDEIQNLNIGDVNNFLESVKPVSFYWKDTGSADTGFIAQDLINEGFGYLVSLVPNSSLQEGVDPTGVVDPAGMQFTVNYNAIIPLLTAVIQEQAGQISSISGQIANLNLTASGDLNITQDNSGNYQLTNTTNNSVISQIAALGQLVAANIKAGAITTTDFVTQNINAGAVIAENITANSFTAFQGTIDNLLISSGLVAGNIQTKLISPLADGTDVTVQVGSTATPSGQFVIQNASGSAVATIDNSGNATFSGTLRAGTIYADNIIGTEFASNSADLQKIQDLLTQVQADQSVLNASANWNINTATDSASINNLAVSNLYVTNQAAINSLSVTTNFSLGTDFVFGASNNSIDTLSAPLRIQSLAMAPVQIMAGLVTIDTQGNVNIAGDLFVAGRINSSGLTLSAVNTPQSATSSADLLTLKDTNGNEVSSINASGSAQFNSISTQGLTIAGGTYATASAEINGVITTNATAGTGIIPSGVSEVTINNPKVTDYTLVYVTPTSTTNNYVLYVKSKQPGQFVVGFSNPPDIDVNFNWWIVQVTQ
jgi:hypothetical protein